MGTNRLTIPIFLSSKQISLQLFDERLAETLIEKIDADENGESRFQIEEGNNYEYRIEEGYNLAASGIVSHSSANKSSGRISPNIYVGTLTIDVLDSTNLKCGTVELEVQ